MEPVFAPIVIVDDREDSSVLSRLADFGANLQKQRLATGDFVVSDRVAIERKTSADFESSIVDGRLFAQASELNAAYEAPIIGVVGKAFERIGRNAINGAVIALTVDFRIPVMFFESEADLCQFICSVAKREQQDGKREVRLQLQKKPVDQAKLRQFIVEGLPGIGPTTANSLLESFGSVENVFTADEDELASVDGIGEKSARQIRLLISSAGKKEEKEKKELKLLTSSQASLAFPSRP